MTSAMLLGNGRLMGSDKRLVLAGTPIHDVWGFRADIDDYLEAEPTAFIRTERDRITAHIGTLFGRQFVHDIDTDPWQPLRGNAWESLAMLDTFTALLGVKALHYSPQSRGLSILDFSRADHPEWFAREIPPDWEHKDDAVTPNFTRRIFDWKAVGGYLHKWDTRAAWAAAARTTPQGYGEMRRVNKFDPKIPGIWSVMLRKPRVNPSPIMDGGWYATEIVRAAIDCGSDVAVGQGWTWANNATTLRPFCERLFKARAAAAPPPGIEYTEGTQGWWIQSSIKRIYTRTFGALDAYRQSRPKLYQPHWYYALRAESARRMWKLYESSSYFIGIDTDSLFAVAPRDVDPLTITPTSPPGTETPGRLRYEGCTPLTRELFDMLGNAPGSAISAWIRERNCLQEWERDE